LSGTAEPAPVSATKGAATLQTGIVNPANESAHILTARNVSPSVHHESDNRAFTAGVELAHGLSAARDLSLRLLALGRPAVFTALALGRDKWTSIRLARAQRQIAQPRPTVIDSEERSTVAVAQVALSAAVVAAPVSVVESVAPNAPLVVELERVQVKPAIAPGSVMPSTAKRLLSVKWIVLGCFAVVAIGASGFYLVGNAMKEKEAAMVRALQEADAKRLNEQLQLRAVEDARRQQEAAERDRLAAELAAAKAQIEKAAAAQASAKFVAPKPEIRQFPSKAAIATVPRPASEKSASTGTASPNRAPSAGVVSSQEPPVTQTQNAPTPAVSASPRDACGSRVFIALALCMSQQCRLPGFANHEQCIRMKEIERQNAERPKGGDRN